MQKIVLYFKFVHNLISLIFLIAFLLHYVYNTRVPQIPGCGSVWGATRALTVADEARGASGSGRKNREDA